MITKTRRTILVSEQKAKSALFLDRDGVINVDHGYVHRKEDFVFVDGIFDLTKQAADKDFRIVIITNQSGIGRGLYSEEQFLELSDWLAEKFRSAGVIGLETYFCPHHPEMAINEYRVFCDCRKPRPGLLFKAAEDLQIDLNSSIFIGDSDTDMEAAYSAGVPNRIQLSKSGSQYSTEHYSNLIECMNFTNVFR